MATVRETCTGALRKVGALAAGQQASAEDATDAAAVLQSIYTEFFASGLFGRLADVRESGDYTAEEGQRIGNSGEDNIAITLPEDIDDDWSEDGVRRPIGLKPVVVVGQSPGLYVYSANRGSWDRASSLELSDFAPLSDISADGLQSLLAVRISPEHTEQLSPVVLAAAQGFRRLLALTFDNARTDVEASYY